MHLLISFLLLCGLVCSFVSAGPSPQWLYEQIHAIPDSDNDHEATELHAKKSNIPDKNHMLLHKRKDGVKRLFNFLDSAIRESGSGSGEGSGHEQVYMATKQHNSGSTGLTRKQSTETASSKQQTTSTASSSDRAQHKTEAQGTSVQVSSNTDKTGLTGHGQQGSTGFAAGSNPQITQVINQYAIADQQGGQRHTVAVPQRTAGYMANTRSNSKSLTYSTNTFPYARSMQGQKTSSGYSVAGQRTQSYGYTASRRRPPAIPVRSRIATNQALRPQPLLMAQQHTARVPQRSNVQGPFYSAMTMGPNQDGGYFMDAHGYPVANGKSAEPLQEKAYGQPKRQRDQFHQQTRALIPSRVPVLQPYNRYPYPSPVSYPGQVRAAIQPHFPYQRPNPIVSRARMPARSPSPYWPAFKRVVTSPPNPASLPGQIYYRNAIPQQQANFAHTAQGLMRSYGYPQARVGRAVINRKPQPRTLLTSLTAAAARLVVPARPEAYEKSATAESVWSAAAPERVAHVVRSNTHPGNL